MDSVSEEDTTLYSSLLHAVRHSVWIHLTTLPTATGLPAASICVLKSRCSNNKDDIVEIPFTKPWAIDLRVMIGVTSHVGRVDSLLVQAGGLPSAGDGGRDDAARQSGGQNLFLVPIVRALFNSFIQHVNTTHHLAIYTRLTEPRPTGHRKAS